MSVPFAVTFVDPESLIRQLTISSGSVVADFGCGSGYFSLAFAKAVGKEGKVIALDILPSALDAVASRARMAGFTQVSTKRANLEKENGSGLAPESVDWVILKDILFQNKSKDIILKEVHRVVRPGGHVLLMEWKNTDASVGPDLHLRISREELTSLVQSSGFSVQKELSVGDFHYAFLLMK
ncbi:MAG: class I SAM-dependent methyltransferase [Candidatus Moranbacteria bacterium]|nr:class I SAM-dependent methyltransferase [Candidatus Moranbacteria bacterium]